MSKLTRTDGVREHVMGLQGAGATYHAIAAAAGLGTMTVHDIVNGHGRVRADTAAAVLAVTVSQIQPRRLDSGGTRLRLRALQAMGHSATQLARAMNVHSETVQKLIRGDAAMVSVGVHDAAVAVFERWWDKRPPERTRIERAAAAAARNRARRHGWCTGMGLDEDELDVPGYRPLTIWRPARGTGVGSGTESALADEGRRPVSSVDESLDRRRGARQASGHQLVIVQVDREVAG